MRNISITGPAPIQNSSVIRNLIAHLYSLSWNRELTEMSELDREGLKIGSIKIGMKKANLMNVEFLDVGIEVTKEALYNHLSDGKQKRKMLCSS